MRVVGPGGSNPLAPTRLTILHADDAHGRVPEKPGVLIGLRVKRDDLRAPDVDLLEQLVDSFLAQLAGYRGIDL